jgi:hypothetical protein
MEHVFEVGDMVTVAASVKKGLRPRRHGCGVVTGVKDVLWGGSSSDSKRIKLVYYDVYWYKTSKKWGPGWMRDVWSVEEDGTVVFGGVWCAGEYIFIHSLDDVGREVGRFGD